MERPDTVARVIAMRRQSPTMGATAIADVVGVSVSRASKILRDANLPRERVGERPPRSNRRRPPARPAIGNTEFACIVRELGEPVERVARMLRRDTATVRGYCRGAPVPEHIMALMYLAAALGAERTNALIHEGRTVAAGLVAKNRAKNLADPC